MVAEGFNGRVWPWVPGTCEVVILFKDKDWVWGLHTLLTQGKFIEGAGDTPCHPLPYSPAKALLVTGVTRCRLILLCNNPSTLHFLEVHPHRLHALPQAVFLS